MFGRLKGSKAAWTAIGGILAALGAALAGAMSWAEALPIIFTGLGILFLRDGIAKAKGT